MSPRQRARITWGGVTKRSRAASLLAMRSLAGHHPADHPETGFPMTCEFSRGTVGSTGTCQPAAAAARQAGRRTQRSRAEQN